VDHYSKFLVVGVVGCVAVVINRRVVVAVSSKRISCPFYTKGFSFDRWAVNETKLGQIDLTPL
jgi:hypothetical protein